MSTIFLAFFTRPTGVWIKKNQLVRNLSPTQDRSLMKPSTRCLPWWLQLFTKPLGRTLIAVVCRYLIRLFWSSWGWPWQPSLTRAWDHRRSVRVAVWCHHLGTAEKPFPSVFREWQHLLRDYSEACAWHLDRTVTSHACLSFRKILQLCAVSVFPLAKVRLDSLGNLAYLHIDNYTLLVLLFFFFFSVSQMQCSKDAGFAITADVLSCRKNYGDFFPHNTECQNLGFTAGSQDANGRMMSWKEARRRSQQAGVLSPGSHGTVEWP